MGKIIEIASSGLDEYLQGIGGDPYLGSSSMGLRVPGLATPNANNRYLFLLASFTIGDGASARIVGYRQFASLGFVPTAGRFVEQPINSPNFRLPDGNISWHIQRLGPPNAGGYPTQGPFPLDLRSFKKGWADGSCLLYRDYTITPGNGLYMQLTGYDAPNDGKPWGTPLRAGTQGTFYDQRVPWLSGQAWQSLDMTLDGPDTIAFFASVYQSTGVYPSASSEALTFPGGLSQEEQFIANFGSGTTESPHPVYWRVSGSLIVEL